MSRKQRTLAALVSLYAEQRQLHALNNRIDFEQGITADEIASSLQIWRSNCSADLNDLVRSGEVSKIPGRPVRYIPLVSVPERQITGRKPCDASNNDSQPSNNDSRYSALAQRDSYVSDYGHSITSQDALLSLDGAQHSLVEVITRAKTALQYPPNGIHTLLLGETGVGKSTFARRMHAYAVQSGLLWPTAPFVSFNCAEYSSNPQILLDHLFGHVRGAFTGAIHERVGLVESANGGILFLDEVHRLPPEGQEMLFEILDYGQFKRLGETNNTRHTKFLLLAATTEAPESVLLHTFRRRIPMVLRLPSLRDWFIRDRYGLIYKLFHEESKTTNSTITVSRAVLMKLLYARFPANIGDLMNTIRRACAIAYAERPRSSSLTVSTEHINVSQVDEQGMQLMESLAGIGDMVVHPNQPTPVLPSELGEDSIHIKLDYLTQTLASLGFESDEIGYVLEREIQRSYKSSREYSRDELRRFVGSHFYDWSERAWTEIVQIVDAEHSDALFIRVTMHLFGINADRDENQQEPPTSSLLKWVQSDYPHEYEMAKKFTKRFSVESGIHVPEYENAVVSLILRGDVGATEAVFSIYLVMRGTQVADSLAQAAQDIAGVSELNVMNVPVSQNWTWIQSQFEKAVESAPVRSDLLVMSDIPEMVEYVRNQNHVILGHRAEVLFRPDTTVVLHALLNQAVTQTVTELADVLRAIQFQHIQDPVPQKKLVVLACCLTGRGTAKAMKRLVESVLPENLGSEVVVETAEVGVAGELNRSITTNIIACVGSVNPKIRGVPFFSVEEALTDRGVQRLLNVILCASSFPVDTRQEPEAVSQNATPDYEAHVYQIMEKDLLYVNPKIAFPTVKDMFRHFERSTTRSYPKEFAVRFYLHVAYILERCIRDESISHPYADLIRTRFSDEWSTLLEIWAVAENVFNIPAPEGEIAYLFEFLFPDRNIEVFDK
ncbi:sigma 54-interacting transcriptional regulator [Alicyclobacillus sp. ALC3]|uniref:sigma 54-interacting transcriptional regulator n=1 Tax=Alicyclobacillus sp. ALC3 TaxID=2796143 RepID=UPI002378E900|nr:sigma 54-interacting transcriptional regulator [Alicyclobacillus sp. ALC3]WDL98376.1 sigma 54-interacting transcriptional regulator [Alicyclobacillus sp. ALC3]